MEPSPNARTVESYEQIAHAYARETKSDNPVLSSGLTRLAETVPNGRVLEIGSGPGWDADFLERAGLTVRRTDITQGFIDVQRSRGKEIDRALDAIPTTTWVDLTTPSSRSTSSSTSSRMIWTPCFPRWPARYARVAGSSSPFPSARVPAGRTASLAVPTTGAVVRGGVRRAVGSDRVAYGMDRPLQPRRGERLALRARPAPLAELLNQPDDDASGAPDVAVPVHAFELHHLTDELGAVGAQAPRRRHRRSRRQTPDEGCRGC